MIEITKCPGTLADGFSSYSNSFLRNVFNGKKVSHILPYDSPVSNSESNLLFKNSRKYISISGFQEKFSVLLEKNVLRLIQEGEQGQYILKPIPTFGKKPHQMPANEHLTMQIARQVFGIETADNELIFFKNGEPAYLTKRFDVAKDGTKRAQEDFASLAGKTPQTHGEHYKYDGNYLEIFHLLKKFVPAYPIEAPKLLKLILFNYLFSNSDAHFKNFSIIETKMGDFKLSPAYDLINSSIHIDDSVFALEDGLLPKSMGQGKIAHQFGKLSEEARIYKQIFDQLFELMVSKSDQVEYFIQASYLDESTKRHYLQTYQGRLNRLIKWVKLNHIKSLTGGKTNEYKCLKHYFLAVNKYN